MALMAINRSEIRGRDDDVLRCPDAIYIICISDVCITFGRGTSKWSHQERMLTLSHVFPADCLDITVMNIHRI